MRVRRLRPSPRGILEEERPWRKNGSHMDACFGKTIRDGACHWVRSDNVLKEATTRRSKKDTLGWDVAVASEDFPKPLTELVLNAVGRRHLTHHTKSAMFGNRQERPIARPRWPDALQRDATPNHADFTTSSDQTTGHAECDVKRVGGLGHHQRLVGRGWEWDPATWPGTEPGDFSRSGVRDESAASGTYICSRTPRSLEYYQCDFALATGCNVAIMVASC